MQHKGIYPKIKIGAVIDFQPNYFKFVSRFAGSTGGEGNTNKTKTLTSMNHYRVTMQFVDESGRDTEFCRDEVAESENEACQQAEAMEPESWARHATLIEENLIPS